MFNLKKFKFFESMQGRKDKFNKIKSEIDSVSYIMEDEKMKVDVIYSSENYVMIRIEHLNPLMGHGDYSWIEKYDWFAEWFDRVQEIVSNNGFKIKKFDNQTFIIDTLQYF